MFSANVGEPIDIETFALRACVALVLGLLVGIDRQIKYKPLDARVYSLIALGSACFMMITLNVALGPSPTEASVAIDPSRVIQGLIGGIGFLGAGAIIGGGEGRLRGVGSGAAVWVVGSVGIACGLGYFAEAAIVAVLTFLILFIGDWTETKSKIKDAVEQGSSDKVS